MHDWSVIDIMLGQRPQSESAVYNSLFFKICFTLQPVLSYLNLRYLSVNSEVCKTFDFNLRFLFISYDTIYIYICINIYFFQ